MTNSWLLFLFGFIFSLSLDIASKIYTILCSDLTAVYDLTIAYKHQCPFFLDNVFGVDPSEVHIHIRRIPVKDIPASNTEADTWLIDTFKLKDQLLSDFKSQGHFPHQRTEEQLSTLKFLLNFTVIISLTTVFTYLTFSSKLYKIYVSLACLYLAYITHYKIRPMPVLSSAKLLSYCKGNKRWIFFRYKTFYLQVTIKLSLNPIAVPWILYAVIFILVFVSFELLWLCINSTSKCISETSEV